MEEEVKIIGEYEENQKRILEGPTIVLRENDEKRLKQLFDDSSKVNTFFNDWDHISHLKRIGFNLYDFLRFYFPCNEEKYDE